jgi:hypothetical protein
MTELAKSYFDCFNSPDHLPIIKKKAPQVNNENTLEVAKLSDHGPLSVLNLRKLLRD